jgi:hypothetical protein
MKSSLRTLIAVSALAAVLPGCFRNSSEGCSSCGVPDDMMRGEMREMNEQMPEGMMAEEMMVTPEGEEEEDVMVVGQNTPVTEVCHDHSEK